MVMFCPDVAVAGACISLITKSGNGISLNVCTGPGICAQGFFDTTLHLYVLLYGNGAFLGRVYEIAAILDTYGISGSAAAESHTYRS